MLEEDALPTTDVENLRGYDQLGLGRDLIIVERGGPTDVTRSRLRISRAQERRCS
jgi:hypothetical protein